VKRFQGLIVSGGVIAAAVAGAHAGPVYMQFEAESVGRSVVVSLAGGLTFADGTASSILWAGERSVLVDGQFVRAFSGELTSTNEDGWYEQGIVRGGPSEAKAQAIGALFAGHGDNLSGSDEAATFQAVLWEIVYDFDGSDRSIDMAGGKVSFGLIDGALFDSMKRTALRRDLNTSVALLSNDTHNDQFRIIPLPSGAGLAGLGLFAFAPWRRRRAPSTQL